MGGGVTTPGQFFVEDVEHKKQWVKGGFAPAIGDPIRTVGLPALCASHCSTVSHNTHHVLVYSYGQSKRNNTNIINLKHDPIITNSTNTKY